MCRLFGVHFLGVIRLLGRGALAAGLWGVQVARGTEWTARIRGSSEATVRIPSIRGEIRDRNGTSLVQNRASYEVDFYLPEMVKGYRQRYGQPPLTVYRSEEHTSELQSHSDLVCRLLLEKKKKEN